MARGTERSRRVLACTLVLCALAINGARADDYKLSAGDVIEVIAGTAQELHQRAMVGTDGAVVLPLIGRVDAAGLDLTALRERVQTAFATKVYRRRAEDGRTFAIVLSPDEVNVTIAEYRPVYLNGDVAKPGAQPFRPGLTVRQAVSLAGGYDVMRFRMNNPFLETADLRSEYETLWLTLAKDAAVVRRLEAELAGQTTLPPPTDPAPPIPKAEADRIDAIQQALLQDRLSTHEKERTYLATAVQKETARAALLTQQEQAERAAVADDTTELARVQGLLQRGQVQQVRLLEAKRSILLSSTRVLQTQAQEAVVERGRDEYAEKLDKLDELKRIDLRQELQNAVGALAATKARLGAVGDKLAYSGMVRSALTRGGTAPPQIAIIRDASNGVQRVDAKEDSELAPGDTIEVALPLPNAQPQAQATMPRGTGAVTAPANETPDGAGGNAP
jgi:polysaccharide export outer membrane protein